MKVLTISSHRACMTQIGKEKYIYTLILKQSSLLKTIRYTHQKKAYHWATSPASPSTLRSQMNGFSVALQKRSRLHQKRPAETRTAAAHATGSPATALSTTASSPHGPSSAAMYQASACIGDHRPASHSSQPRRLPAYSFVAATIVKVSGQAQAPQLWVLATPYLSSPTHSVDPSSSASHGATGGAVEAARRYVFWA